ncbi:MAG: hypothetical protein ACIALR_07520 [Blastopirellula sp. JB062]
MLKNLPRVSPQTVIAAACLLLLAAPIYGEQALRAARRVSLVHSYQQALPGDAGQYRLEMEEAYHWCDGSQGRVFIFSATDKHRRAVRRQVVLTDLDYVAQGAYQLDVSGKLAGVSLIPRLHPIVELILEDEPHRIRSVHFRLSPSGVERTYFEGAPALDVQDPADSDVVQASSSRDFPS